MEKSCLQRARFEVERFKRDQQYKVLEVIEDSRRLQGTYTLSLPWREVEDGSSEMAQKRWYA